MDESQFERLALETYRNMLKLADSERGRAIVVEMVEALSESLEDVPELESVA